MAHEKCKTNGEFARLVASSFTPAPGFYTPESKEALDEWIKTQRTTMPTGIALMVGINYICGQLQQLLPAQAPNEAHEELLTAYRMLNAGNYKSSYEGEILDKLRAGLDKLGVSYDA